MDTLDPGKKTPPKNGKKFSNANRKKGNESRRSSTGGSELVAIFAMEHQLLFADQRKEYALLDDCLFVVFFSFQKRKNY